MFSFRDHICILLPVTRDDRRPEQLCLEHFIFMLPECLDASTSMGALVGDMVIIKPMPSLNCTKIACLKGYVYCSSVIQLRSIVI